MSSRKIELQAKAYLLRNPVSLSPDIQAEKSELDVIINRLRADYDKELKGHRCNCDDWPRSTSVCPVNVVNAASLTVPILNCCISRTNEIWYMQAAAERAVIGDYINRAVAVEAAKEKYHNERIRLTE